MNTQTGKRYSFSVYPSVLLPTAFNKVTMLIPSMPAQIARSFADIDSQHAAYLPVLPEMTPVNPDDLLYCYVQLPTGEKVILSHAWINQETLIEISGVRITVTIEDESLDTVEVVRELMAANNLRATIAAS